MKKIFSTIITLTLMMFLVTPAFAAPNLGMDKAGEVATDAGYAKATSASSLSENIGFVISIALSFVGIIFMVLMISAGYKWMSSRGESEVISEAQNTIKTAIIGLIITLAAYSITNWALFAQK